MRRSTRAMIALLLLAAISGLAADDARSSGGGKRGKSKQDGAPARKKGDKTTGSTKGGASGVSKKADMSPIEADEEAEKRDLDKLGPGFKVKRTQHYSVLYNTSDADVGLFGVAIEQTYRSCLNYAMKLEIPIKPPPRKLLIYYFEEYKDYAAYCVSVGKGELPQSTVGLYLPDLNRSLFYNYQNQESFKRARETAEAAIVDLQGRLKQPGVNADERRNISRQIAAAKATKNRTSLLGGDVSESVVQHEVAHQVLWNIRFHNAGNFFANPRWFAEGTAMMFEPISDGSSANFGAVNTERLRGYQELERDGKLIPLREFIGTHLHFGPDRIAIAYPQSWALAHYLNRAKRKQLKEYVAMLNARSRSYRTTPQKEIETFEKAFGELDAIWERNWKKWMTNVH